MTHPNIPIDYSQKNNKLHQKIIIFPHKMTKILSNSVIFSQNKLKFFKFCKKIYLYSSN